MMERKTLLALIFLSLAGTGAVRAQSQAQSADPATDARLTVELNAAQQQEQGCKLSFVVTNAHPGDIAKAVFETVIFDSAGQVSRLTLFDFGALPSGRPRVRQFVIPGTACEGIGQVLFNGADTCDGGGEGACTTNLTLATRTDIEVTG
ncbi:hypothetical protein GCM10011360_14750 [Primorskyibacter flagellatus]|uniref:Tat pathway signal sequence domain protein n=1 Tax=Primorskyibacter flagellatus TaxID=1387277 RepID=A0A917A4T9_9RHOB|nr:hypothetical protein [Primorskyibacter flagellatus]GGE27527.1 hypothetical protein GCM10011360_14750 [Primorskyibacter flagellatus]